MVTIETGGKSLGMLVMGGVDRPNAVFRRGDKPGVFVVQIQKDGAAKKCERLRVGDRILTVSVWMELVCMCGICSHSLAGWLEKTISFT